MLEVVSGSGNLSRSFRLVLRGLSCFELDIINDAAADVLSRKIQKLARGWVRSKMLLGVWIATPCQSLSRARNRPNGPPPLRDAKHPLGLPHLNPADCLKVAR
eukprot:36185-Pyramimonas_sp.AAC.1